MGKEKKHDNKTSDKYSTPQALAALIKNTRTQRRSLSLIDIADWLDIAISKLGSVEQVAERIGLSTKMLRQFQYVRKLSPTVQTLFAKRQIDSVDTAVHLIQLPRKEQIRVAKQMADNQLDSADVRAITELKKQFPQTDIDEIIEKIKKTKNVKHYIAEFVVRLKKTTPESLRKRFTPILGKDNIISIDVEGSIGRLSMTSKGRDRLQQTANLKGVTKAALVESILEGEEQ